MLDNLIVLAYLFFVLFIGLYYRSRTKSLSGYGKVENKISGNKLILLATIFATSVGGGTTFGISEKAFSGNIAYSYGLIITVIIDLLIAMYLVPRIVLFHGSATVGDIMEKYYGLTGKIITGIAATLVSIGYLAAQISVSARIFEYFLSLNFFYSVLLSYIIVIIYTTFGGLRSTVVTDILQFFLMVISIPILLIIGIKEIGGVGEFIQKIPEAKYVLNDDIWKNTIIAILSFSVMGLHPTFIQRILLTKDTKSLQISIYRKIVVYIVFIGIITSIGLVASIIAPDLKSMHAIPYLIDTIIPVGLKGVIISGLLASVMSTADSDLNVAAMSLVNDIYKPLSKSTHQENLLIIAKITTVIIGSLAIIIALNFQSVVDLVIFVAGFWSPMIFVPLIVALYGKSISQQGFLASSILGVLSFSVWELWLVDYYKVSGVFIGTCVSLVIFLIFWLKCKIRVK
ncbi:MAG: Sodium/pantothenate symporter [Rickettsiaceae bacterium]|jgi:Na+/proline symporter|nr:Sodium/pantothenate symporter [Rickettsiaceae bacterium]